LGHRYKIEIRSKNERYLPRAASGRMDVYSGDYVLSVLTLPDFKKANSSIDRGHVEWEPQFPVTLIYLKRKAVVCVWHQSASGEDGFCDAYMLSDGIISRLTIR
jgi:hypothetical protein